MNRRVLVIVWLLWGLHSTAFAGALDAAAVSDPLLGVLVPALAAQDIDVAHNLNAREVIRQRLRNPRLGRFPDLPLNGYPTTQELLAWEEAFAAGTIGGLALLGRSAAIGAQASDGEFIGRWLDVGSEARVMVAFHAEDLPTAEAIAAEAAVQGWVPRLLIGGEAVTTAGHLYATAAQRLAIDTRRARRLRSDITEFELLGERVRRDENTVFSNPGNRDDRLQARNEPSVFLKETLGDEFNQSTIREIVVPGGVALGETAALPFTPAEMRYAREQLWIVDDAGNVWALPALDKASAKALFDFVQRSQAIDSDAIVDIDEEGRVKISSALRDTEVGYAIMHADTQPFAYVPNLPVTKSVVIDTEVEWLPAIGDGPLHFSTAYEVRFLSADNMRIAQTRAALEYSYRSLDQASAYRDAWGREVRRLRENLDYAGLGNSMNPVAEYAGWIALLRALAEQEIPFLEGRYAFMKIDKTGRNTPSRY